MDKLKWMYRLARTKTYVLATDKESVVSIPVIDLKAFDNILLLTSQKASLVEFHNRLGDLIKEHDKTVKLLTSRVGSKLFGKTHVVKDRTKKA